MVLRNDDGPELQTDEMFRLKDVQNATDLNKIVDQMPDLVAESSDDEDGPAKQKFAIYDKENGPRLDSSGKFYKDSDSENDSNSSDSEDDDKDGLGFSDTEASEPKFEKSKPKSKNPLLTDLDYRDKSIKRAQKAEMWFQRDVFKNLEDEDDEDFELDKMVENYKKQGREIIGQKDKKTKKKKKKLGSDGEDEDEDESSDDTGSDEDYNVDEALAQVSKDEVKKVSGKGGGYEVVKKRKLKLDEEGLALGSLMVQSKKMKRDLIDSAWNRYTFNDSNLPDWFVEDEKKHMRKEAPVPKVSSPLMTPGMK